MHELSSALDSAGNSNKSSNRTVRFSTSAINYPMVLERIHQSLMHIPLGAFPNAETDAVASAVIEGTGESAVDEEGRYKQTFLEDARRSLIRLWGDHPGVEELLVNQTRFKIETTDDFFSLEYHTFPTYPGAGLDIKFTQAGRTLVTQIQTHEHIVEISNAIQTLLFREWTVDIPDHTTTTIDTKQITRSGSKLIFSIAIHASAQPENKVSHVSIKLGDDKRVYYSSVGNEDDITNLNSSISNMQKQTWLLVRR